MKQKGYVYYDKKEKSWYARTTITQNGKRRNLKRRATDKLEAKQLLKSLLAQMETEGPKFVDSASLTFNDLANFYESKYLQPARYVEGKKIAGLRDVERPRECVKVFRQYFGTRRLREITYSDIDAFRLHRLALPTRYNRTRTIGTWNREASVLRRMLNLGVREGWLPRNPFSEGDGLIITSFERRRERILTTDEEVRLLEACEHPQRKHLRPLLIALLDTGARKSEMLKLRWCSVCFVTHTITIEGMTTKTLKTRQVAMTGRLHDELSRLWAESNKSLDGLVFGIKDNVRKSFAFACKLAGIEKGGLNGLNLHSLRHTAASRLVKGQMPLQMVGRILGHSQPHTTYRYVSADSQITEQAARILESFHSRIYADASIDAVQNAVN